VFRWSRWALPLVLAGLGAVPAVLLWSRLPGEVAIHWDADGEPNGHAARWVGVGGAVVVAVALATVLLVELRRNPPRPIVAFLLGTFGSLATAVATTTTLANRDAATWRDGELSLLSLLATGGSALVGGAAALWVLKDRWSMPTPRRVETAGGVRAPGERMAWSGTAHSGWAVGAALLLVGLTGFALFIAGGQVRILTLLYVVIGALIGASMGAVRVTVGAHGLTARAPLGRPALTIRLDEIERVESTTLGAMSWGGWGYRGSLRVLGRSAWIVRQGEGIVLDLTEGRQFAITVDDATAAAETLARYLPDQGRPVAGPSAGR
jgi:hypothetical protein